MGFCSTGDEGHRWLCGAAAVSRQRTQAAVRRETGLYPELLSGYGLIAAPISYVAETFGNHDRADQSQVRLHRSTSNPREAAEYLRLRTSPATRLVLVDLGSWTGVLTNHRGGSSFSDHAFWAARTTQARTVRVVDHDARWDAGPPRRRLAYAARIVAIRDRDGSTVRSIACADDAGRWVFETFGEPLPVEAEFDYSARGIRDRFTSANLHRLLEHIGVGPLTEAAFLAARRFVLLDERYNLASWQRQIAARAVTVDL